jgi:hypothetical protein
VVIQLVGFMAFLLYPSLCTKIFKCWQCTMYDGQWRLVDQLSLVCWEGEHIALASSAVFFGLAYIIGIPVIIAAILLTNRTAIKENQKQDSAEQEEGDEDQLAASDCSGSTSDTEKEVHGAIILAEFGIFYQSYSCWYFELVEIARKLVLTGGLIVFSDMPLIQSSIGVLSTVVYLAVCLATRPMRSRQAAWFQLAAAAQLYLTLQSGVMLVAGKCEGAAAMHVMDNILTSLTAVTSVAGVTMIVMQVRRAALSIREACGLYMKSDAKLSDVANAARALSIVEDSAGIPAIETNDTDTEENGIDLGMGIDDGASQTSDALRSAGTSERGQRVMV